MNRLKHLFFLAVISSSLTIGAFSFQEEIKTDPFLNAVAMPAYSNSLANEPKFSDQFQFNHLNRGNVLDSYRGDGITIAIIDSGINVSHVDFISGSTTNILSTSAYIEETNTSGVGYSAISIQTVASKGLSIIDDTNGHGTNVAGTIGAMVNGVGTAGLSPNVNLLILKTSYQYTEINRAIKYAADNGADIINMSIEAHENTFTSPYTGKTVTGYIGTKTYFQTNINYAYNKGVTLVGAAGNHATTDKSYPASNTNVISVGALASNSSTNIAAYSNLGDRIDLVAPGGVYVTSTGTSTSYKTTSGTSFASPLVASAIALYKQKFPNDTPSQIKNKLADTAYDLGDPGKDTTFGHGRLDLTEFMSGDPIIPVTGVSLSPKTLDLKVGQTAQLTATITPSDATNKEVIFISNDDDVATVDEESGLVTATGIGETEIGVLTDDGLFEDSVTVKVTSNISYTPTLTLNTSGVKTAYTFKEPLDLSNLTAQYFSSTGQTSELSYSDLTLVSGDTGVLGTSSLVFSYEGLERSFDITVTNVGSEQGEKEGDPKNVSIKGNNSTPALSGSTADNYDNISFGGVNFSGQKLRNINSALYIGTGGLIYNKDPLDYITSITMNYASGTSPYAYQTFYFSSNVISSTSGLTATKTLQTSTPSTSATVTAPDNMSYFRINISNKNIQTEIVVNYKSGGIQKFTDLEQTDAYYDYFMAISHEECLVKNVTLSTWNTLKTEYNAMAEGAKNLLKSDGYKNLQQRYLLILDEYEYEDFIYLYNSSLFSRNYAFVLDHKDEITIITILMSSTILSVLTYKFLRRKKDKVQ